MLRLAKSLYSGGSRRFDCPECGGKGSVLATNSSRNWRAHCFRCDATEQEEKELCDLSLKETSVEDTLIREPGDLEELSDEAIVYLATKGIKESLAKEYGIKWISKSFSIVIPVNGWHLVRNVRSREVKNLGKSTEGLFGSKSIGEVQNKAVLVEDALSMMKVGEVVKCYALMGTSLKNSSIAELMKYDEVLVWLDPDGPGQTAAKKVWKQLNGLVKTRIVHSNRDPKYLSKRKIREVVC
jgi:5S rRNA maturation endonuclease (ribonuclease M5)